MTIKWLHLVIFFPDKLYFYRCFCPPTCCNKYLYLFYFYKYAPKNCICSNTCYIFWINICVYILPNNTNLFIILKIKFNIHQNRIHSHLIHDSISILNLVKNSTWAQYIYYYYYVWFTLFYYFKKKKRKEKSFNTRKN